MRRDLLALVSSFASFIRRLRSIVRISSSASKTTPCTFLHGGPKCICLSHSHFRAKYTKRWHLAPRFSEVGTDRRNEFQCRHILESLDRL